ncbi:MAG: crossover junction endodeoxyribonuclease RuvC [Minisyncoccia bacterium]
MRILGIDPGFGRLGIGIVDVHQGKETCVYSECFETNPKDTFHTRLKSVGEKIQTLCEKWQPNAASVETLFFEKNQKTAMSVAEARGVIVYELLKNKVSVSEYSPLQVKMALTGFGKAEKSQVAFMVQKLLHLEKEKRIDDELDALALAITHSSSSRNTY